MFNVKYKRILCTFPLVKKESYVILINDLPFGKTIQNEKDAQVIVQWFLGVPKWERESLDESDHWDFEV